MATGGQIAQIAETATVTLAASEAELRRWVWSARIGERLTFAIGEQPPRDQPVWKAARDLVDLGLVRLFQPRRPDGHGFDYLAERVSSPVAISDERTPEARVFAEIVRCARASEPMPTDAQLARRCGLRNVDAASFAVRKLKAPQAGDRRLSVTNWGPREHRQAVVLATGEMTIRRSL